MSLLDDWALALKKALEEKNLNVLLKLAGHAVRTSCFFKRQLVDYERIGDLLQFDSH